MICSQCGGEFEGYSGFQVALGERHWTFCGRLCLVDFIAPDLRGAIVTKQWLTNETPNFSGKDTHSHRKYLS